MTGSLSVQASRYLEGSAVPGVSETLKEAFPMKMLLAIISYDDSQSVISALTKAGFSVTKLATTGGFLKAGNVTVLIGLDDTRLDEAFGIIHDHCRKRRQIMPASTEVGMGFYPTMPVQVEVGGATVFVLNVERFEKL